MVSTRNGGEIHLPEFSGRFQNPFLECGLIVDALEKIGLVVASFACGTRKTYPLLFHILASVWHTQGQQSPGLQNAQHFTDSSGIAVFAFNVFNHGHRINNIKLRISELKGSRVREGKHDFAFGFPFQATPHHLIFIHVQFADVRKIQLSRDVDSKVKTKHFRTAHIQNLWARA